MSTFDNFFLGEIVVGIGSLIVSHILQGTNPLKRKWLIAAIIAVMIIGSIFLAKCYGWQSSILGIPSSENTGGVIVSSNIIPSHVELDSPPPLTQDVGSEGQQSNSGNTGSGNVFPANIHSHVESDSPTPSTQGVGTESEQSTTITSPTQEPQGQVLTIEDIFSEAYETHSPNNSITTVLFREWNSSTDSDLRGEAYLGDCGFYTSISNMFNAFGASASDNDRITFDIHFPLRDNLQISLESLTLAGFVVAEQGSAGSDAYADVALLVDDNEIWRSEGHITSNTVNPIEFSVNLGNIKSEMVIRTSCVPVGSGLSLGFVGLGILQNDQNTATDSQGQNLLSRDEDVFVNVFESHFPKNDSTNFITLANWDTFTHADLREEHYSSSVSGQLFLKLSNIFNELGASGASAIVLDIHLPINPKRDVNGLIWTGLIVAEKSTQGSSAYADVAILVDGVEKWRTQEPITGNTVQPSEFSIDLSEAKYEVIIRTSCVPLDNGLALGIVNMEAQYS